MIKNLRFFRLKRQIIINFQIVLVVFLNGVLLYPDLNGLYSNGVLALRPDKEFGKGTDWENIFFDTNKNMIVAPNGNIFVSDTSKHNVMVFNSMGVLIRQKTSQLGHGPGDLMNPNALSVLDEKYLVIGEYALNRRISLFDLNGNYKRVIRTSCPVYQCLGLKNNKIALVSKNSLQMKGETTVNNIVKILDIQTRKETEIAKFTTKRKSTLLGGSILFSPGNFEGDVYLDKTNESNLIVGFSNSNFLTVYTPEGKELNTIQLNIKQTKVTDDMLDAYKREVLRASKDQRLGDFFSKKIENLSFSDFIPEYLPFFTQIRVAPNNTLWVFESSHIVKEYNNHVQVYSVNGKFIGKFRIDFGEFKANIHAPISFYNGYLYGLFEKKGTDDIFMRIVKIKLY